MNLIFANSSFHPRSTLVSYFRFAAFSTLTSVHAPAQILLSTGSQQFGRPSLGSWVTYGLRCETDDLPAFVVMSSAQKVLPEAPPTSTPAPSLRFTMGFSFAPSGIRSFIFQIPKASKKGTGEP